ncbi:type VI secretion system baseplate subunit TssE [Rhodospirillum sp. A1_3_36]|uniref:type VI secretion system baseplate subunit TssE n=1 Tax=Rhodospirillum sp. A1_3_36 TaxID=3391666 RepID=UPI0039A601D9
MTDRLLAERLQPSLLDRLTDNAPDNGTDSAASRTIDLAHLREIVQRDLSWLLNTANIETEHDLEFYPHVARSVVNYGLPGLSGSIRTRSRVLAIQRSIHSAIETFEPRILPGTLEVTIRADEASTGTLISFDIRGELWADPVPVDFYLRTALDVTTGAITVNR